MQSKVKLLREQKNLTQTELAEKVVDNRSVPSKLVLLQSVHQDI